MKTRAIKAQPYDGKTLKCTPPPNQHGRTLQETTDTGGLTFVSAGQAGWAAVGMAGEKRKQGRAGAVRVAGDEEGDEEASAGVASLLEVDEVAASWMMGEGAVSCVVDEVAVSWALEKPQVVEALATGLDLGWADCQCWCHWPLCRVRWAEGRSSRRPPGNADRPGMLGKRIVQWRTGKRTAQFKVMQGQAMRGMCS